MTNLCKLSKRKRSQNTVLTFPGKKIMPLFTSPDRKLDLAALFGRDNGRIDVGDVGALERMAT
jgi:hypothetical protein